MKLIFVCSPYRGNVEYNTRRARGYCRFVYTKGEVPFASHLLNTQFLDDEIPEERFAGIQLGLEMLSRSDELWVFGSKMTDGMKLEIEAAKEHGIPARYFTDTCEERKVTPDEQNEDRV